MSASILWEPINRVANNLSVGAPQWFMASLEQIGANLRGPGGEVLTDVHLPALRGMAFLYNDRQKDPDKNPYTQLINALEKYGSIRLWAEY